MVINVNVCTNMSIITIYFIVYKPIVYIIICILYTDASDERVFLIQTSTIVDILQSPKVIYC